MSSDQVPASPEQDNSLFTPDTPARSGVALSTLGIAILAVMVIVAGVLLFNTKSSNSSATATLDPYVANLVLSGIQMSESTSLSGGKSTFIDGRIRNKGQRILTGASVQVLFRNDLELPPQIQTVPLMLVRTHEPYTDTLTLRAAPLLPGDDREFRLTFESVAANWNQHLPEVRFTQIKVK